MSGQQIRLRTVYELRVNGGGEPVRYFIPAYQRGYRWNATQVTQLLQDIREFTRRKNPQPEEFYCLQPLVLLRRTDGSYEVVDGQQRLTTLLLILRYFNGRMAEKYRQTLYTIEYATRPDLLEFLQNPSEELSKKNIDYFHIAQAMMVIEGWFERHENEVEAIKDNFLNKTKVIWFELSAADSAIAAFTRLNVGKIPLTNAELIRALFLRNHPGETAEARRLRIAYEWDLLEKTLQEPAFWSFTSNEIRRAGGRIDFLFDLTARQQGMKSTTDNYATFNHFSEKLSNKAADPADAWLEVKRNCMLLEEWFADRQLYHLVGFLIWDGVDIDELRKLALGSRKSDLKERFKSLVVTRAFGEAAPLEEGGVEVWVGDRLDGLEYPRDRIRIRSLLLLFNIATLLLHPRSNIRFHFESFKTANWDIEHVRSVASAELGSPTLQAGWLSHVVSFLKHSAQDATSLALQEKINAHLRLPPMEAVAAFESIYGEILGYFHENDSGEPDHTIANLALLDQETNRSYKNAVFPVKRQRILDLDAHGVFVPHCTRNVFLKSYSPQVGHTMYWTEQDRAGYRQELVNTLTAFIIGTWTYA